MQSVGLALEELLVTAQKQGCLTVGIYESAKLLNAWVESIHFGLFFSCIAQTLSKMCECICPPNFCPLSPSEIQTVWYCASWQLMMKTMWDCRSTSRCYSPFAVTATSPSCESRVFSDSSSCWELWMPTGTRKSTETCTACWLRCVDIVQWPLLM